MFANLSGKEGAPGPGVYTLLAFNSSKYVGNRCLFELNPSFCFSISSLLDRISAGSNGGASSMCSVTIDAFGSRSIIEVTVANRRKMTTPFIIGLDLLREDADDE